MKLIPLLTMGFHSSSRLAGAFSHIRRISLQQRTMGLYTEADSRVRATLDNNYPADSVNATTSKLLMMSNEPEKIEHVTQKTKKEGRYQSAREKRRKFIGLAKAVDRGQHHLARYNPGFPDFQAHSGLPDRTRLFTVLGIESSCDDTGAAVVRSDGKILGEALASQQEIHEKWGGVVPGLARDAHVASIDAVIQDALRNANVSLREIDAIGVTVGPGLELCLRVGCNKARELAMLHQKPFIAIHHLEAHVLMARIGRGVTLRETPITHAAERAMDFPFLALLVSGGHCQLLKCHGIGNYTILGGTIDDSLAYDKTARLLGLPIGGGGGPAVERLAKDGNPNSIVLPIPLRNRKDCDFSYAGLKTAVRVASEKLRIERGLDNVGELPHQDKANLAASFQNVAIKHIEQRLLRAMLVCERDDIKTLAVVGGVAANQELRSRLATICTERQWQMHVPPPRLCTDQGAMSAWAAVERIMVGSTDNAATQEVYARYPFACIEQQ